jgi:tetratricopeptide (TPR) repeat protein
MQGGGALMYAYNPRKKSFQQLEKSLVGKDRWDILNSILKELSLKKGVCPKQHWMLVGPRGIGKSHLLSLLYYKITNDEKLRNLWIPVLFPEELRMAGNLSKFLERAAREICQDLEKTNDSLAAELKSRIDGIKNAPVDERTDYLFSVLTWLHKSTGRFILLITENLQQLLGKRISLIEQKKLRAYLQTEEAVLLIGSATTVFGALHDHSHPFYHFFHISRLDDLSFDDLKSLIINLLTDDNQHELAKKVTANEARIRALYSFTGGNPRIAVFLADMLKAEMPDEMMAVMDKILDEMTPYFEAILTEVPRYQEEILNTLAAYEPAQSPKDIAGHLEVPQPTVRNYLKQVKENGYVRVAFSKGKYSYYCLKEYLYRIWYQMRDSSHREETRWLMELLLMLYSPAAIAEEKRRLDQCASATNTNVFYNTMISKAASFIEENPDYYKVIEMCVAAAGVGDDVSLQREELYKKFNKFAKNKEYREAIKICTEILKMNPLDSVAYVAWGYCLKQLERYDEAIDNFTKAFEINPKSELNLWIWGDCLREQRRYEEAIDKFKEVTELKPDYYTAYGAWGDCLRDLCRYEEAEQRYLKTIEINPKYEDVYFAWGESLMNQKRYEDAINLYKRLLKINRRSERAYKAWAAALMESKEYDKAIRIYEDQLANSKDCMIVYRYGKALFELKRYHEALVQFQKLIDLHFDCIMVYLDYGYALEKTGKKEEALIAYLRYLSKPENEHGFQEIFKKYISPLIGTLRPEDYLKQFYAQIKEWKFSRPVLATLLLMHGKYDVVNEHVADIITACNSKSEKERQEVDLFIFTIKLCIWQKLSEGKVYEALRPLELFIQHVKLIQSTGEKEKEVSDLILSLFKLQVHTKVEAGNIREVLNAIRAGGVPFNEVFIKVWTCISEPDSVDAQKYLNEKAIGEIVTSLKETAKPTASGCSQ